MSFYEDNVDPWMLICNLKKKKKENFVKNVKQNKKDLLKIQFSGFLF